MSAVLELRRLTKDYGGGRGVFDVSFAVEEGEVFGFLGPNGAGKTVTMRNLMGFVRPDAGNATIKGMDCFNDRACIQDRLGYLPGEIAIMDDMTGRAFLEFMARMKRLEDRSRARELIEMFELDPSARIRKMSKGTKQKVGLVCAFMTRPAIILLDEPTSGLDPLMQNRFIDLVLAEKKRGATIMLSSHLFEEVERTCDRVAFIRAGKIAAVERMDDVRASRKRVLAITFSNETELAHYRAAHPEARQVGQALETTVAGDMDGFVKDLAGYGVADLTAREQTLEELFLHLYGIGEQDGAASGERCLERATVEGIVTAAAGRPGQSAGEGRFAQPAPREEGNGHE
ncbi:ABC transporter ATP-binding protein [Raoultibacter phocaeensis]|uniref:ABC transporter ATP-binding protein n=1 Tax=Raoultibacter phocaeensis TaxID=2479841 RepID=UPI0011186C26|nr:ABC transporter ATP-binding protein [Raoultibacter phocaeensis]